MVSVSTSGRVNTRSSITSSRKTFDSLLPERCNFFPDASKPNERGVRFRVLTPPSFLRGDYPVDNVEP